MPSTFEAEKNKLIQERCQTIIINLLKDEDNKYCVDCDAKSPRWASWNLGIFLCIRCAGIHRNLGVHISKVKSVNLDTWTPQQVACIQQMGNSRARAVYEANQGDNFRRPQTDSALEQFIRAKYEAKKYIAKEWVEPPMPKPTWDAEVEKQLKRKKEKKISGGSIEFAASIKNKPSSKSSGISPKPLPKAPGGRSEKSSSPAHSEAKRKLSSSKCPVQKIDAEPTPSHSLDLIGLDMPTKSNGSPDNSDPFGDFLSAPVSSTIESTSSLNKSCDKENPDQSSIELEESNFFGQTAPAIKSNEKLSKDSILALYAKSPPPSTGNMFGAASNGVYGSVSPGFNPLGKNNQACMMTGMSPQTPCLPGMGGMAGIQQQNVLNYQQMIPNSSVSTGQVPAGIQLSPANPFAQMQSQMGGLSLTPPCPMLHQPVNNFNAQMGGMRPSIPSGLSQMPNPHTALSTNLWQ